VKPVDEALRQAGLDLWLKDAALESAATAVAIGNLDRTVRYVNAAFLRLFGYERRDVLGQPITSLSMLQDGQEPAVLAAIQRDGAWTGERRLRHTDGSEVWAEQAASLVRDQAGELCAMIAFFTDISARKRADAEMRASEARYRTLFNASGLGIALIDVETRRLRHANPTICRMLGYNAEELCGLSVTEIHPPEAIPRVMAEFDAVVRRQKSVALDIPCLRKDGAIVYADISADSVEVDGCQLGAGFFRDVTDRRRTQAELHLKDAAIARATSGIALADLEGRLHYVNDAFLKLWGYASAEQVVGRQGVEFWLMRDRAAEVMAAVQRGDGWIGELDAQHRAGHLFQVQVSASLITGSTGEPLGLMGSFIDVTERRRAEESLARRTAELERSNRELEQFAYVASHDLQEPLRMVSSYTQLLASRYQDKLDQDAFDFIEFAVSGANRMQRLINDLLEYSRVSTRGKPPAPVDAHAALGQAVALLSAAIDESQAMVVNGELPVVRADCAQLTQVFLNLIGNAIKFRRPGNPPRVEVSAQREGPAWVFAVRDNAVGIEPRYFPRLFQIFQRLHGKEFPGTGIGLALCKRIVERHGGRVWVESQPGIGSTFYFTLPEEGTTPNADDQER
jgi:PAS domain S-box-containing protein